MSAVKIAEPANVEFRFNWARNDAFESFSCLLVQRGQHRMRSFANRDHKHATVRIQVIKVFADPQHAAFTRNVPGECLLDT